VATSCFIQGLSSTLPFGFAGKSWNAITGSGDVSGKVFLMALGYVMMRRLASKHVILREMQAPMCSDGGCSVGDAGMIDSGPLTPSLAYSSYLPRQFQITMAYITGPAATFSMFNYQIGMGPFDIWSAGGAGVNSCPFLTPQYCSILTTLRKLMVQNMDKDTTKTYIELGNAFGVHLPENQIIAPFCGDPISYDEFHAQCKAQGFCSLAVNAVPSKKELISFTAVPSLLLLAVVYLSSTPIAENFVLDFLPKRLFDMPYFDKMSEWFPNFQFGAEDKGGMGFNKPAGHSLMDFMSYLSLRLVLKLWQAKDAAFAIHDGHFPPCGYHLFEAASRRSMNQFEFINNQRTNAHWDHYSP